MNEISGQEKAACTEAKAEAAVKESDSPQSGAKSVRDDVKEMAVVGCSDTEIADYVGCRTGALKRRFGKVLRQARAEGNKKLREAQWNKALDESNVPLLIWLGRQRLGQSQRPAPADEAQPARIVLDMSLDP